MGSADALSAHLGQAAQLSRPSTWLLIKVIQLHVLEANFRCHKASNL